MPGRHRASAVAKLEHAPVLFKATRSRTAHDQAVREPRQRQTDRQSAPQRQGLSTLSRRELEIAELVADGRTNRQIARTLSLSEKTIETHLSHVFSKLGVSSRAAVASTIARADRVHQALEDSGPSRLLTVPPRIGGARGYRHALGRLHNDVSSFRSRALLEPPCPFSRR
jgi:DNA-binding CsgD family transcriptional regulator